MGETLHVNKFEDVDFKYDIDVLEILRFEKFEGADVKYNCTVAFLSSNPKIPK